LWKYVFTEFHAADGGNRHTPTSVSQQQIRQRYTWVLDPAIDHSAYTAEEEALMKRLFDEDHRDAAIAKLLPGRTTKQVANHRRGHHKRWHSDNTRG
jgi:hypothetical protein